MVTVNSSFIFLISDLTVVYLLTTQRLYRLGHTENIVKKRVTFEYVFECVFWNVAFTVAIFKYEHYKLDATFM